jgi:hypothetical protein
MPKWRGAPVKQWPVVSEQWPVAPISSCVLELVSKVRFEISAQLPSAAKAA